MAVALNSGLKNLGFDAGCHKRARECMQNTRSLNKVVLKSMQPVFAVTMGINLWRNLPLPPFRELLKLSKWRCLVLSFIGSFAGYFLLQKSDFQLPQCSMNGSSSSPSCLYGTSEKVRIGVEHFLGRYDTLIIFLKINIVILLYITVVHKYDYFTKYIVTIKCFSKNLDVF